ncbi:MAG: TonB-dependent receptor [Bacteroidota bacterium]|nr:TonB-dependent receptor [Bacteroidota bacterium]
MKRLLPILLFLMLCSSTLYAQNASQRNQSRNIPIKGTIAGTVYDEDSIKTMPGVSIMLCNRRDSSMVKGVVTDDKGKFALEVTKAGVYFVKIRFMGYRDKIITPVVMSPNRLNANLGKIVIRTTSHKLNEVVVTAEPPDIQQTAEKTTLNVKENTVAAGGTALDLLQLMPNVNVNTDGTVQLRGSDKVKILMDGRPSMFNSLEQVPSEILDKIEVMTNPSSRYEAEGQAGIINMITNKNKVKGYMINANTNMNSRGAYGAGTNLSYRKGHWNFMGGYNFRMSNIDGNTKDSLSYYTNDSNREQLSREINQHRLSNRKSYTHNVRFNTDYYFNDNSILTFQASGNIGNGNSKDSTQYQYLYFTPSSNQISNRYRATKSNNDNKNANFVLAYDKKFKTSGKELSAEVSANTGKNNSESNILEKDEYVSMKDINIDQKNLNEGKNNSINAKLDYEQMVGTKLKIEMGERSNLSKNKTNYNPYAYNSVTAQDTLTWSQVNDFDFNRDIHSAYLILNYPITKKLSIKAGARYEYTHDYGTQHFDNTKIDHSYQNIYPSLFLTQKLDEFNQLNLIYGRRFDRPNSGLLNPKVDKSNPLAIRTGNPNLKPEDVHSVEFKYIYNKKGYNVGTSVYYRLSKDIVTRSITMRGDTSITSYINNDRGHYFGSEFNASARMNESVRFGFNANWNRTQMDNSTNDPNADTRLTTWSLKFNTNVNLQNIIGFQIFSNYFGPVKRKTGTTDGVFSTDVALRKQFFNRKVTAFMRVSDVFKTRANNTTQKGYITADERFTHATYGRESTRFMTFGLNFNFSNFIRKHGDNQGPDRDRYHMREGGERFGGDRPGGGGGPGGM